MKFSQKIKFIFAKKISIIKTIHYNYFCKKIIRNGNSLLFITKNSKLSIDKNSSIILNNSKVYVGHTNNSDCEFKTKIILKNGSKLVFENGDASINDCCITLYENASLRLKNFVMSAGSLIRLQNATEFGDNVIIARMCFITDLDGHFTFKNDAKVFDSKTIKIGNDVWIGANSTILKGTNIGNNCIIASGSLLANKIIPNDTIAMQKRETALTTTKHKNWEF